MAEHTMGGGLRRRDFLVKSGGTGLLMASSGLLAACGGVKESSGSGGAENTIKIGYVSPRTGPAASFGEPDPWILEQVNGAMKDGIQVGGKTYDVQILLKDSQSDPQRAAAVANDLINNEKVDMLVASSTPESVNPVSDAAEANGIPCISTVVPWQAWYFGRGAEPTDPQAFKYVYHFSFGVENFGEAYISQWSQIPTNKKVGVMWPNDSDGNAIRQALGPMLEKGGYKIVDPGAYENGTNDFSAQIAKFKSEKCEIFNTFPLPPDFATFWKQAAQQGYKPKIAQLAKTGLFPSQVEALGPLGDKLATAAFWHPAFPYKSSLTGLGGKQISDGYESATGRQWTQVLGTGLALFDAAIAALKASPDPKDKAGVAKAISTLSVETPVGQLAWGTGPNKNVVADVLVGCQWVKSANGKFPLDLVVVENVEDKKIPVEAKLKPYS